MSQRLLNRASLTVLLLCQIASSQYRNWSILNQFDTLTIFAKNQCAGLVVLDNRANPVNKKITTKLTYSFNPSVSETKLIESRVYGFDGQLQNAKQTIISASGTTKWTLERINNNQWSCKTKTGGKSERIIVDGIKDNLISEYNQMKHILNNTMTVGMTFYDTAFDMVTRENFILKTKCVKVPDKNYNFYEFELQESRTRSNERWIVDTQGRTVEQDFPPIYQAKREKCDDQEPALNITDLWDMFKVNVSPCFQSVSLKLSASYTINSSIAFLYKKLPGNSFDLNEFNRDGIFKITPLKINTNRWLDNTITIQKDNSRIIKIAKKNAGTVRDRLLIVKNLTFFVFKYLDKKAVGTFSNAIETLEAGYGDCGEHAVLLAALLRAVNIPANVVLGLVTIPGKEGYFYHAWVVVPMDGGVVFADAALGNAPATSGYIPLILDPDGRGAAELVKLIGNIDINCR